MSRVVKQDGFGASSEAARMEIRVKLVSPLMGATIPLPDYATEGAAAMDLHACCTEPIVIAAHSQSRIPTGIAIELPSSTMVALVFPRSGLASKHGIALSNAVGVIDSDYRGEIICLMKNDSAMDYRVQPGDRIAQLAFLPVIQAQWVITDDLTPTARSEGGFGSTGTGRTAQVSRNNG